MITDIILWYIGGILLVTAAGCVILIRTVLTDRAITRRLDKAIELLERLQND